MCSFVFPCVCPSHLYSPCTVPTRTLRFPQHCTLDWHETWFLHSLWDFRDLIFYVVTLHWISTIPCLILVKPFPCIGRQTTELIHLKLQGTLIYGIPKAPPPSDLTTFPQGCAITNALVHTVWKLSLICIRMMFNDNRITGFGLLYTDINAMMTSSNGNIFHVTGPLCGSQWIPRTKGSDAELWCFLWSAPE